ncbi:hypothetical protein L6452_00649 [Arctium lappa]|uniref:Uncharacterized protein n=1 Tax=Arctium lappa TaxID=4217 RepID=A0ACB9FF43_ARCLA|nr:hypothetical protein L6452_00649 [Arctium lappa]
MMCSNPYADGAEDSWVLHVTILDRKIQQFKAYHHILKMTVGACLTSRNDAEDMVFNAVQQHGDYIPMEELDGETSSNQCNMRGSSNEMREIRNNIANMIWNANNVF